MTTLESRIRLTVLVPDIKLSKMTWQCVPHKRFMQFITHQPMQQVILHWSSRILVYWPPLYLFELFSFWLEADLRLATIWSFKNGHRVFMNILCFEVKVGYFLLAKLSKLTHCFKEYSGSNKSFSGVLVKKILIHVFH